MRLTRDLFSRMDPEVELDVELTPSAAVRRVVNMTALAVADTATERH